jgi:hypothetical protein
VREQEQMFLLDDQEDRKWFNSPVRSYKGTLADIPQFIPDFDRRDFALASKRDLPAEPTIANARLDMIIREPFGTEMELIPIGVVSKDYVLVKHAEIIKSATKALRSFSIWPEEVGADLTITEYGERMSLSLYLPEKYTYDPGDGDKLAMRLEFVNSVDGSTRFRVMMGWFRFVCSNGLVVGVTQADIKRRHVGDLSLDDVGSVLSLGLEKAESDRENFRQWRQKTITDGALVSWIEKDLKDQWGFKAATRVFHIARTGYDVEIAGLYKDQTPTTIKVEQTRRVRGSPFKSKTLFDVSQILAWLARDRRDVQEQLEWRDQIPGILEPLMN